VESMIRTQSNSGKRQPHWDPDLVAESIDSVTTPSGVGDKVGLCKNSKSTTFSSSATSRAIGVSITHVYSSSERHRPVLEVEPAPNYARGGDGSPCKI